MCSSPGRSAGTAALERLWDEIAAFGENIEDVPLSELQARLSEYERRILDVIAADVAVTSPATTEVGSSPGATTATATATAAGPTSGPAGDDRPTQRTAPPTATARPSRRSRTPAAARRPADPRRVGAAERQPVHGAVLTRLADEPQPHRRAIAAAVFEPDAEPEGAVADSLSERLTYSAGCPFTRRRR